MFDVGWPELFLIGVVALIVIGPKDLPQVMRSVALFVRKARALSQEFQSGVAQMMREAELDDLKRKLEEAGRVDVGRTVKDAVDPNGSLSADFDPAEFARDLKQSVEEPTSPRSRTAHVAPAPPETPETQSQPEPPAAAGPASVGGDATNGAPLPREGDKPDSGEQRA
ncbi:MAG: twin-arginine translocase subunit TatB [Rhodospirillales bacterium]|nr:twin-arginine translocase subunit TatB [Rhodospirillales bacterium]